MGDAPFDNSTVTVDLAPFQIITLKLQPSGVTAADRRG